VECRITEKSWIFVGLTDNATAKVRGLKPSYTTNYGLDTFEVPIVTLRNKDGYTIGEGAEITQNREATLAKRNLRDLVIFVGAWCLLALAALLKILL